ncbi:transposase [Streptomyces sp. NPDC000348]|uniref:transposase n=1 Tax=Streptomyces sp. NPDC000348 TaxID=3364538 RepID=UPI0036BA8880
MSDELWSLIEPMLPEPAPKQAEGLPRVPDRQVLCGILFVFHTGIQWEYPPQELGFGSGMTCWRRLVAWNEAGVREQLLNKLRPKNQLDWSRAVIGSPLGFAGALPPASGLLDGAQKRPQPGRPRTAGQQDHIITDGQDIRSRCR